MPSGFRFDGFAAVVLRLGIVAAFSLPTLVPEAAHAVPSFAVQTDQPCSSCHVGAFGPRLKQAGRDFKLYGYSATDMQNHFPPIAATATFTFTHTSANELSAALEGYGENNNTAFQGASIYYGGKIVPNMGALVEVAYDPIANTLSWGDMDVRYARDLTVSGSDVVVGATVNNSPTEADLWESESEWSFPFVSTELAEAPQAASIIDAIPGTVIGAGAYAMWNDSLYLELNAYNGLGQDALRLVGNEPIEGMDWLAGPAPYWRIALQHEFLDGVHYLELGTYGVSAAIHPGGISSAGSDDYLDTAIDFTYQWTPHPESSTSDMLSLYVLFLHENANFGASERLFQGPASDDLSTLRAEVTYSSGATLTPTLQYFQVSGSPDAVRWSTPGGIPDSQGWIAEVDFVPWGKPDSSGNWYNARAALQYIAYTKFDGQSARASDYNTLLFALTFALAPIW